MSRRYDAGTVAVVGGGLAGISAALGCADAGHEVTLFESRPRLGGLTHSFRRHGMWVDNGQHVFLRCCTSYLALLARLGVTDRVRLQPRLDVPVRSETGPGTARLSRNTLPAPLHLAAALMRYRWLDPTARLRVIRAALAMRRVDRDSPDTDERSFGDWLAGHGQSERAVATVWDLIGVATLNAPAQRASLALAATVFQLGLLGRNDAADIGWSMVPLQHLHGDAAAARLAEAGATVRTRAKVTGLTRADGWRVHTTGATPTEGPLGQACDRAFDHVVLAAPAPVTESLLPPDALDLPAGWSERLGSTPILNAHLVWDRPVLDVPFVAAVDGPLQWVFDRTVQSGMDPSGGDGQYLALSLSAAEDLIDVPVAGVREHVLPHLHRLLPTATSARLKEFFVTREPHATFRSAPGSRRWRPASTTRLPGLHLAGAWTDTGWPATMEGAVRSGESAVRSVLGAPDTRAALEGAIA